MAWWSLSTCVVFGVCLPAPAGALRNGQGFLCEAWLAHGTFCGAMKSGWSEGQGLFGAGGGTWSRLSTRPREMLGESICTIQVVVVRSIEPYLQLLRREQLKSAVCKSSWSPANDLINEVDEPAP